MDCPFIAALISISWVNRNFILNNIKPGSTSGTYTIYFWDYQGVSFNPEVALPIAGAPCQIASSNAMSDPPPAGAQPVRTGVTVAQTIPLDQSNPIDPISGISYGAGSSNNVPGSKTYEIWPALYEKAFAKFLLYKSGKLTSNDLTDITKDPTFSQLIGFSQTDWGGNAGYVLKWLTGLNCWVYDLTSTSFSPVGALGGAATGQIFQFIKLGFCQSPSPFGTGKTKFPLVAWTFPPGDQPAGVPYSSQGIIASHCYPILGTFETASGKYLIVKTTFGKTNPSPTLSSNPLNLADFLEPNSSNPNSVANCPSWTTSYDALFSIVTNANAINYPKNAVQTPNQPVIKLSGGIFGIEASIPCTNGLTTFQNYFTAIGWAGY